MRDPKANSLSQRRAQSARVLVCALATGLLALSNLAGAVSLCASTAQEFQDDLAKASDGGMFSGDSVEINLVQGTYTVGAATANGPFIYTSTAATGQLTLLGGWNPQCNGLVKNGAPTVLDGNGTSQVLKINNPNASVDVEYLTIQNGETGVSGAGLSINVGGGSAGVFVADNIIRNNHTTGTGGGLVAFAGGSNSQLDIGNNVIAGNSADVGYGAGFVFGNSVGEAFITGNTVYANTTTATNGTGGLLCCGTVDSNPDIFTNIFWQNTKYGLYLSGTAADLEYNDYGAIGGAAPGASIGNISMDPKFVDGANDDLHLATGSPALGYGPAATLNGYISSTDINGHAYPLTGKIDLGAYEETVFADGFDGN
jgi:hypothetical protein